MSKIISMSLYGDITMYIEGAIKNIELAKKYYPDWELRMYCADTVDTTKLDCETILMGESLEHSGMFWRFLPLWEGGLDKVIVRDTDSRIGIREVAAVEAWEASDKICHSMHDHEHHRCYPLFGGMFGLKCDKIPDLGRQLRRAMNLPQDRVEDMNWLRKYLWPEVKDSTLHHSSVPLQWPSIPFPEEGEGFVGQQHGDDGPISR